MTESSAHTLLFVDDEESILKSMKRLFRREGYRLLTASGGEEGLNLIRAEEGKIAVIVSDQKMPGMNGAQFLEKAKVLCPDAIRFLLTGYSEMNAIVDAVNRGEIHKYLTKPWNDDDLIIQVRQAVEQYDLKEECRQLLALTQKQNKQLYEFGKSMEQKVREQSEKVLEKNKELAFLNKELEYSLLNTIRAFAALSEMHTPGLKGHGKRVSSLAVNIAKKLQLDEEDITDIEIAAVLHDIGTIGFAPKLIDKYLDNRCSADEMEIYRSHPVEGQAIVSFISKLDNPGILIRHHHEYYDGKGYPDGISEDDIPLGSRILSVANTYDRIVRLVPKKQVYVDKFMATQTTTPDHLSDDECVEGAAVFYIKQNVFTQFDPEVVKAFLDVLKEAGVRSAREKSVSIDKLEAGMILSRSVYTSKGRFLLPHKTVLSSTLIEKLKYISQSNDRLQDVFIDI